MCIPPKKALTQNMHCDSVDDELATQTYRAWIMSMMGQRKMMRWSKEDLVKYANVFARHVLGRTCVPPLQRDLVVQLGLADCEALNIVDGPTASEMAAQAQEDAEAEEEPVLVVKLNKKEIGLGFMKEAKQATEAILALDQAAALAMEAALHQTGMAHISGFTILRNMVTAKLVSTNPTKKPGSSSSNSPGDAASAAPPSRALSSLTDDPPHSVSSTGVTNQPATHPQRPASFKPDPEVVKAAVACVTAAGAAVSEAMGAAKAAGGDIKTDARVLAATQQMVDARLALTQAKTGRDRAGSDACPPLTQTQTPPPLSDGMSGNNGLRGVSPTARLRSASPRAA